MAVADWKFGYYISAAPLVVKDKLLVGMSGDQLDMPGFLEARDLNDGKLVWRWDAIPKPGDPDRRHGPTRKSWRTAAARRGCRASTIRS